MSIIHLQNNISCERTKYTLLMKLIQVCKVLTVASWSLYPKTLSAGVGLSFRQHNYLAFPPLTFHLENHTLSPVVKESTCMYVYV